MRSLQGVTLTLGAASQPGRGDGFLIPFLWGQLPIKGKPFCLLSEKGVFNAQSAFVLGSVPRHVQKHWASLPICPQPLGITSRLCHLPIDVPPDLALAFSTNTTFAVQELAIKWPLPRKRKWVMKQRVQERRQICTNVASANLHGVAPKVKGQA